MVYSYIFKGVDENDVTRFEDDFHYIRDKAPEREELEADLNTFLDDYVPIYNYEHGTRYKFRGTIEEITEEEDEE